MRVTVEVSDRNVNRIIQLGSKPWTKITDDEEEEYENLIGLCGTAVCMKILYKD